MAETRYSDEHEWIEVDGDIGTVGITEYAQQQLGDVVYVELPEVGTTVAKGGEVAVVESVKAASELYAPVSGEVVETNEALEANPALVNESAMDEGWFMKIKLADLSELDDLLDADAYGKFVAGLD
jgi:glycine cleavage system H protein